MIVLSKMTDSRKVLAIWLLSRFYILILSLFFLHGIAGGIGLTEFFATWHQFDTYCYESVTDYGYMGSDRCTYNTAFFPALPFLMSLGQVVGLSVTVSGMLVSLVASGFASVGLGKLARHYGANPAVTVGAWLLAPMAVFLFAAYTEALFVALSIWAWWFALHRQWVLAGILAGVAGLTRSNAIFLGSALIVMFILSRPSRNDWLRSPFLLLPFVAVGAFFGYLYLITGSWTHWFDIQASAWGRSFTDPLNATINTFELAFGAPENGFTASRFYLEIINTAITLAAGIYLLIKRRWPEAFYVLITMASLVTGTFFQSTPRATLILFPVWLVIGSLLTRSTVLRWVYFIVAIPVMAIVVNLYMNAEWLS